MKLLIYAMVFATGYLAAQIAVVRLFGWAQIYPALFDVWFASAIAWWCGQRFVPCSAKETSQ